MIFSPGGGGASMAIERLVGDFRAVEDPRCRGKIEHRLTDILAIAVCAAIACAESWDDIALYGRSKLAWLRTFLELPNGIPSHDTFRRVFILIDPEAFEAGFTAWAGSLAAGFEREVVAIDGKTLRRSFDRKHGHAPLHLVSAWASEQDLVLGQRCVDDQSNEITAIPELLDRLALQNSIVTVDAMGCQTAIAERILARGGDYLLTLKANPSDGPRGGGRALRAALLPPWRSQPRGLRRLRRHAWPPGPPPGVRQHRGCRAGSSERLARVAHRAGRRDHPRRQRHAQGRGRDPPLPVELPGRSGHPWSGGPHALGHRERAALGARCHLPRGRQPRARPARRAQPGGLAQDRDQPRRPRLLSQGQCARQAQEGRVE